VPPKTRYAQSGDVHIAWQAIGKGPADLVLVPGWISHVEQAWEVPAYAACLRRLADFCRVILLDRRGTGLSDSVGGLPTLEQRMDDVRAVMDAASRACPGSGGCSRSNDALVACNARISSVCARLERDGGVAPPRVGPATARRRALPSRPMHHATTTDSGVTGH
jgi:hypothetical protein